MRFRTGIFFIYGRLYFVFGTGSLFYFQDGRLIEIMEHDILFVLSVLFLIFIMTFQHVLCNNKSHKSL